MEPLYRACYPQHTRQVCTKSTGTSMLKNYHLSYYDFLYNFYFKSKQLLLLLFYSKYGIKVLPSPVIGPRIKLTLYRITTTRGSDREKPSKNKINHHLF